MKYMNSKFQNLIAWLWYDCIVTYPFGRRYCTRTFATVEKKEFEMHENNSKSDFEKKEDMAVVILPNKL